MIGIDKSWRACADEVLEIFKIRAKICVVTTRKYKISVKTTNGIVRVRY